MMPAGEYYIGDLCYVMSEEEWDEFCSITIQGNRCLDGEFVLSDGRRFATYGTAWGDGSYFDQHRHEYAVDAGLIGCILIKDIKIEKNNILELGNVVKIDYDFTTSGGRADNHSDWNGVIHIGPIRIETNAPDFGEEDYDN
jgi:hypothetical protein